MNFEPHIHDGYYDEEHGWQAPTRIVDQGDDHIPRRTHRWARTNPGQSISLDCRKMICDGLEDVIKTLRVDDFRNLDIRFPESHAVVLEAGEKLSKLLDAIRKG